MNVSQFRACPSVEKDFRNVLMLFLGDKVECTVSSTILMVDIRVAVEQPTQQFGPIEERRPNQWSASITIRNVNTALLDEFLHDLVIAILNVPTNFVGNRIMFSRATGMSHCYFRFKASFPSVSQSRLKRARV